MLAAIGDETRQHLLCMMLQGPCGGRRVLDLAAQTNLSRPAVSHHMQILRQAGIVKTRREGTCIYYCLDPESEALNRLTALFCEISAIMRHAPDRSGSDD